MKKEVVNCRFNLLIVILNFMFVCGCFVFVRIGLVFSVVSIFCIFFNILGYILFVWGLVFILLVRYFRKV